MDKFFAAVSLFRRRKYDECIEVCNELLQNNALHQGPWELKMRSMTQRVYIDDIEADDDVAEDILDTQTIATAPRPGTSIRTAAAVASATTASGKTTAAGARPRTGTGRPITGISRPGTLSLQRPGSTLGNKSALKTARTAGSARNMRLGSASMFAVGDPTGPLFHISRLHPDKYAEKDSISKPLFQYLYYHEGEIRKAMALCDAVLSTKRSAAGWWWNTQKARCLITTGSPREAEQFLRTALNELYHPDTVLLLARIYIKIDQPTAALEICKSALEKLPNDITILTQQARVLELVGNLTASVRRYRQISQLDSMNTEALACIAVSYFYGNQPETALLYYRRILSMGAHSAELYCNIGLCCLYGGQLDLVFPCFQRAIRMATSADLKPDVWYNLSFVALTTGDVHLARRCLRLCIATNGSHGPALNNMAVMVARQKQFAKAKSYLMSAKVALPNCDEILNNLEYIENFE
ncbi:tetratricopeptide repeat protein 8 [Topomyia yanbarensis]|uniref:tetratricopeptide repeat protein 8 n=1 Tax=Topomyia yanbarensis TaxID=2498891 RepID=UPI00273ACE76|nr:tetratricopeptide repeat protein 8 [Topomyia yanbarensis]XP_058826414.1 tetratricopeptide repeat protein 8 [Topomyia yanbarensis]XP_058826415.1 tetratricopeptide repeat protein 8 [Topomyia yanbarensis]XP_058826416.1 tetratricopeptide repeat protein 8 [Topomyia yanbarensis]XP_058826417.1 tetratricopeptide repeat protein 8 [Topomyia yanbarensis]